MNAEPSLERDRLAINQRLARFLPAGFYYKTFMWPRRLWPRYEARIRAAAGLGSAPDARDAERYDKRYAHCDVLVLGGGPAGLAAADAAAATGARVILVDEQRELGGSLLSCPAEIDGEPALRWAGRIEAGLRQRPDVRILTRGTAFGYQDHNLVTVAQRLTDHLPVRMRAGSRELLWKIRAGRVILATGAHERPLVFGNNDLPGVMLASAVSAYIHRYGVLRARRGAVHQQRPSLSGGHRSGRLRRRVVVVDARAPVDGILPDAARRLGVTVMAGAVVMAAHGKRRVASVDVHAYAKGQSGGRVATCHAICWRCRAA